MSVGGDLDIMFIGWLHAIVADNRPTRWWEED